LGFSTILPDMDFETYSEAGFIWDEAKRAYRAPEGATKKGIFAVGAAVYAEHPSTEVLSLAYDLKDGLGPRLWIPGMAPPQDLFDHIARGGLIEAWNCVFEYWIWTHVCISKLGWPPLPFWQLRDAMAKARAYTWPGALKTAAKVAQTADQKMTEGTRLINKFCVPRKPTKKDPRHRVKPEDDTKDAQLLYDYCIGDIKAEAGVSMLCPDLPQAELDFWLCTQAANIRGIGLDMETINAGIKILDRALEKYNSELKEVTGGVSRASEGVKVLSWIASRGVTARSLDAEAIAELLDSPTLPADVRRALEIRSRVGSAGVKKLYAMQRMASKAGRAHDLIEYHVARTGRDGGRDIQPQNLVKAGPKLQWCAACERPYGLHASSCPHCGAGRVMRETGWSWEAVDHAVKTIRTGELEEVERVFGDALLTLSGCVRGMLIPAPGYDFICSDYSSVEAVVTAVLAGEQWRIDAFRRKEDIYLVSASRITGTPLEEYTGRKVTTGAHHPDRQKIGKPAELGLGFGGWLGAWRQFDKSDTFTDKEVKHNINAWRLATPAIVELWGGQVRGKPWAPDRYELFGLEGAAISAVQNPGRECAYGLVTYVVKNDALFCRLPSGRYLTYHRPRLSVSERWEGQLSLSFEGWNSNPKMGPMGWIRIGTYGGRLAENVVQATARDIMAHAVVNIERAGYPHVLRVHDEILIEVKENAGNIEEVEAIMGTMPQWAQGWPVRAAGGWRGKRYRKD
jgi:DNA polymerase